MEMRRSDNRHMPHYAPSYKLFIHNIDYKTNYDQIYDAFGSVGKMKYCDVPVEKNGRLKGYAFVEYHNPQHAHTALNRLNNSNIGIRPIKIEFSNPSKEGTTLRNPPGSFKADYSPHKKRSNRFHNANIKSPIRTPDRSPIRSRVRSPIHSRDHSQPRAPLCEKIRKSYLSDYYKPGEFHEKTPSIHEIALFLNSTLEKPHSTVISMNPNRNRDYDGRRRERACGYDSEENRRR